MTKASDPLAALCEVNRQPRPKPVQPPALPFYERHPEWKPRPLTRKQLRRRLIRGG
jgi:hypothetical protein